MSKMTAEQVAAELTSQIIDADTVWCRANESALRESIRLIREHLCETDEQRRERFEAWWWSMHPSAQKGFLGRVNGGLYVQASVRMQFASWQSALTWRGEAKGGET